VPQSEPQEQAKSRRNERLIDAQPAEIIHLLDTRSNPSISAGTSFKKVLEQCSN
jgi:hypothetical protein